MKKIMHNFEVHQNESVCRKIGHLGLEQVDMILGWYLLTELGLNLKLYEHVIKAVDGPFIGFATPVVDLGRYISKKLNTG